MTQTFGFFLPLNLLALLPVGLVDLDLDTVDVLGGDLGRVDKSEHVADVVELLDELLQEFRVLLFDSSLHLWSVDGDEVELWARLLNHSADTLGKLVWHESHNASNVLVLRLASLNLVLLLVVVFGLVTELLLLHGFDVGDGLLPDLLLH